MSRPLFLISIIQKRLRCIVLVAAVVSSPLHPQSPRVMDAGELAVALKKLNVLGSALYIAAHPDDENTAVLAYLAKGRSIRTAYLSLTRGEGGQNLIGPEQGALMGIIRTQELLAARRIDGAEQYFTRALDFGYSKSSDETIQFWDREVVLSDIVWIIRIFKPDVVITRFTPTLGGHGNHTASAILAAEAFEAAGDPSKFPEQLKHTTVWRPKRLVWNIFRFQQTDSPPPTDAVKLDVGEYSPWLGKSFTEIAGVSRSMHKSQGFGAPENRGSFLNYFQHTLGDTARGDLFEGVNLTWSRVQGGEAVEKIISQALAQFNPNKPSTILPLLLNAYDEVGRLKEVHWREVKQRELTEVIRSCAGLWIDALSSEYAASPGSIIHVTSTFLNRSDAPIRLEAVSLPLGQKDTTFDVSLSYNRAFQWRAAFRIPSDAPLTQPYWLTAESQKGSYVVTDLRLRGMPENPPAYSIRVILEMYQRRVTLDVPVRYRWIDPVEGESYRSLEIIPPVGVGLAESVHIFPTQEAKSIQVSLKNGSHRTNGEVRLLLPDGWIATPQDQPFDLARKEEEAMVRFNVAPRPDARNGTFFVEAEIGGKKIRKGIRTIRYPHISPQTIFPTAEGKLVRLELKTRGRLIGYIMGAGDEIPASLRQMGYEVVLLSDEELAESDLKKFDAIVAGVRAYNTRPKLRTHQKRLMEYVESGGTYVVQYVTLQRGESENLGPYPFTVSRERVTVEEAPVEFLNPTHPLLNDPNKITPADFEGWVQERGLYFADKWDERYETVIASADPGEKRQQGGLLVARHGRGLYVYTGYAFFRQLPAGVPGAFRLFANLVSLGAKKEAQ